VRRSIVALIVVAVALALDINSDSQECHFVHPPPPPAASDFPTRPTDSQKHFVGPVIRAFRVQCWSAEPSAPKKCVGGTHATQKVTILFPINELVDPEHIDASFRQQGLTSFSAGGWFPLLKSDDLPPGFFVSFKGIRSSRSPKLSIRLRKAIPFQVRGRPEFESPQNSCMNRRWASATSMLLCGPL